MAQVLPLPVGRVFDVVIVGAGLCGLALARTLVARGLDVQVLEARHRLGGRVHTLHCPDTGQPLDLGPAWFWPDTEPRLVALLAELGLESQPQHDPGDALWLIDPNRAPERRTEAGGIHAGAQRITGGSARLVEALAASLPSGTVRTGTVVRGLHEQADGIELQLSAGAPLRARQVVLALPPRLVLEQLQLEPPLPLAVGEALLATPTWMAAQAKAVTTFAQPFWRAAGQSGNAFVRHPQAVLGEVFDASSGQAGALGGFVALNAAQRDNFAKGLPLLIESQLAQLFGPEAQAGRAHLMDWAHEPFTCSHADRTLPPEPPQADPLLRQPLWGGRLLLGGSETAAHGAGHMEGALESADRIAHALRRHQAARDTASAPAPAAASQPAAIASFTTQVQALRGQAPERYRLHLTRLLSSQQSGQLTQRALLASADQVYSQALASLDTLLAPLDAAHASVVQGRHALTAPLLAAFEGWNKGLLESALAFNRTSCALSNFPQDHQPDAELLRAITLDLAAAWREFALELNERLLAAVPARQAG
jgi:monoamine oxidase